MALTKEERETLERLNAKANEPPEREERIGVNFIYDPDDEASVKRGIARGHLTAEDAESWGYDLAKLGIKKDDAGGGGDDDDDDEKPPARRGYFGGSGGDS